VGLKDKKMLKKAIKSTFFSAYKDIFIVEKDW